MPDARSQRRPELSAPSLASWYAGLYVPPAPNETAPAASALVELAKEFSPRFEVMGDQTVVDVSGLDRLFGTPRVIGEELRRTAAARGLRVHVAMAATRMTALVLARVKPGLTVVERGHETAALAAVPVHVLHALSACRPRDAAPARARSEEAVESAVATFRTWGVKTLGELAALPSADLAARLGQAGLDWQAMARGQDVRPLVPTLPEERFESSIELEWPIEGLEPLSFVLTRLLEPLSTRLERRDRGAAALHVTLGIVKNYEAGEVGRAGGAGKSSEILPDLPNPPHPPHLPHPPHVVSLQLPTPMRDVRALRTLILLDLESHPPPAGIERVGVLIDPTPGRVLQHALFTRAQPAPEQLSTLIARLSALMGQDRLGRPALVDSYRPGAFEMRPFAIEWNHDQRRTNDERPATSDPRPTTNDPRPTTNDPRPATSDPRPMTSDPRPTTSDPRPTTNDPRPAINDQRPTTNDQRLITALRRCRRPIPARVSVAGGKPVHVTTDRRGYTGGAVLACTGPWRTSGEWWIGIHEAGRAGEAGKTGETDESRSSYLPYPSHPPYQSSQSQGWDRDEWDVSLGDSMVCRIFRDRSTDRWFIDAVVD